MIENEVIVKKDKILKMCTYTYCNSHNLKYLNDTNENILLRNAICFYSTLTRIFV